MKQAVQANGKEDVPYDVKYGCQQTQRTEENVNRFKTMCLTDSRRTGYKYKFRDYCSELITLQTSPLFACSLDVFIIRNKILLLQFSSSYWRRLSSIHCHTGE